MTFVFWFSVLLVVYTYLGYPVWLYVKSRVRSFPINKAPIEPTVTVVMAVRNEAKTLSKKLGNILALDYPQDKLNVVIASDGSQDGTDDLLLGLRNASVIPVLCSDHLGKAAALNEAIRAASGEIVLFVDARQTLEASSLRAILANFADPAVGCVSGELMIEGSAGAVEGLGLYWKLEKRVRQLESRTGSVVGATGAIYAMRRSLLVEMPPGTILDDVYLPMHAALQGFRVIFEPDARAWDSLAKNPADEFRRKVRTLTGNYQIIQIAPWLLTSRNPLFFEFISHKVLRLIVPFLMLSTLIASFVIKGGWYQSLFIIQAGFLMFAAVAVVRPRLGIFTKLAAIASSFLLLNAAAFLAFVYTVTGKKGVWTR